MGGNLGPVTKTGEQLSLTYSSFKENRLPFLVRVRDMNQDPAGRIAFMREPKVARGDAAQAPVCVLNVALPDVVQGDALQSDRLEGDELRDFYELKRQNGEII